MKVRSWADTKAGKFCGETAQGRERQRQSWSAPTHPGPAVPSSRNIEIEITCYLQCQHPSFSPHVARLGRAERAGRAPVWLPGERRKDAGTLCCRGRRQGGRHRGWAELWFPPSGTTGQEVFQTSLEGPGHYSAAFFCYAGRHMRGSV